MRIIGNRGNTARKVQAVASGVLASGDTVIVNADGTVSVVAETPVSQAVGSPTVYESAYAYITAAAYDANAQKVVIAYRDNGNSDYGTAIVGTVSGTSISFGSPVVFESAGSGSISAAYDSNAQKVVIAYSDVGNSSYGTAIVGTVSGTSISFGSPVVFESATISATSATYDANAQKVVIAYRDNGNSFYGTAIVGTVSGTNISFGSATVFESADSSHISAVYDANAQKIAVFYQDGGNSDYGTAVVGTVSGTSISFGSPVVFESAGTASISAAYDANAQKIAVAYSDVGNSSYGTLIAGTVSGTSISFGSPLVFENAQTEYVASAYDDNSQKVVVAYLDAGNSGYGTSVVFQNAYASTNLTAENYIGIASNGYASGQAATINAKGFIDDNQSSLTAGQSYFVQTNGDLGLTAADPSVFAGTAVSATKLIVKG